VNVAIGNHDRNDIFNVHLSIAPSERIGDWLFIFADSNFDGRETMPDGSLRDRSDRIMASGELGEAELRRVEEAIATSDAAHVFVWLHRPPSTSTSIAVRPNHRDTAPFEFDDDGTVRSTCHFIDDPRWPRHALPEAVGSYWRGEASWNDMLAVTPLVSDHD
jgi:hypothetical protein